ncbi:MAG: methionyl-tRNA formyltransferase, partial [Hyphomonadaceae bacterium]
GDAETGVQAMRMEEGLDTGPVLLSARTPIRADDTGGALHDRLAAMGAPLLVEAVALMEKGEARFTPQAEEGATYAAKIEPGEARIDWALPAAEVDRKIRGLSPHPGAWFEWGGVRVKALFSRVEKGAGAPGAALDDYLLIACGEGAVRILLAQREGRAAMPASDFLRGNPVPASAMLR